VSLTQKIAIPNFTILLRSYVEALKAHRDAAFNVLTAAKALRDPYPGGELGDREFKNDIMVSLKYNEWDARNALSQAIARRVFKTAVDFKAHGTLTSLELLADLKPTEQESILRRVAKTKDDKISDEWARRHPAKSKSQGTVSIPNAMIAREACQLLADIIAGERDVPASVDELPKLLAKAVQLYAQPKRKLKAA